MIKKITPQFVSLLTLFYLLSVLNNCYAVSQAPTDQPSAYIKVFRLLTKHLPETLDPQKNGNFGDYQLTQHIFDPLFTLQNGEPLPVLVKHYQWIKPTQWEFTLKQGVKFHDGSELTSKDVVATFKRASRLQNNVWRFIKDYTIEALDDYRFRIDTGKPNSELLWDMEDIQIIHHTAEHADEKDFNSPQFLIGTGPYRLLRRQDFDKFELTAFPEYHRGQAFIRNLHIRPETDSQKRVDALLAGEADMIDDIPGKLLELLPEEVNINSQTIHALYFITPDMSRDQSPDIFDLKGKPLSTNPLKDLRVRQAISKALDRGKLLQSIYGEYSNAKPAGQLVNNNTAVANPALLPDEQNIEEAKRLLKESGYPDGFRLILRSSPNNRDWVDAIAVALDTIGILTKTEYLPASELFRNRSNRAYSATISGYTTDGNLANLMKQLLYTGAKANGGGYSNSQLDQQLDHAMQQTSATLKQRSLRKAQDIAMHDLALIPLWFVPKNWVIRKDMVFLPTGQFYSEVYYVQPQQKTK